MNEPFDAIAYINEPRWQASRLGLHRIRDLMERLGRPQDRLRFVHVAGTNGKGSTCAYLASILRSAGYRTGLFTSPYIERFEERIQVDGVLIAPEALCQATLQVREAAEAQAAETGEHATEFELMTAVALVHFAAVSCDIVVLEVGLGGRLDSTNVIGPPEVAVITRIGLDHTALLGDSPAAIAGEKAGIIKPGCAVVAYPQDDEGAARAIAQAASRCETPLIVADFSQLTVGEVRSAGENAAVESDARLPLSGDLVRCFAYRNRSYRTALLASYQPCNAALAIEAARVLAARGWRIPESAIEAGVAAARWPGRFELMPVVPGRPTIVVDGGHNPQGAQALAASLADVFPGRRCVFVMGVLADKDYAAMVEAVLPQAQAFVTVTPPNPRALSAEDLAECIRAAAASKGVPTETAVGESALPAQAAKPCASDCALDGEPSSPLVVRAAAGYDDALRTAVALAGPCGLVVAFGSLYAIADIKRGIMPGGRG